MAQPAAGLVGRGLVGPGLVGPGVSGVASALRAGLGLSRRVPGRVAAGGSSSLAGSNPN